MICHIEKNGGLMFSILCLLIFVGNSIAVKETTTTIQEFCSGNLYIHNIEPGEPYKLTLKSGPSSFINKWYSKSKRKCRQEFKTSDSAAHFAILISDMNIPSCDNCRCNYFEIKVSDHIKRFCGYRKEDYFSSKSDKLSIEFHHGSSVMQFDVSLTFTVERNVYFITGMPKDNSDSSNFIETPYFPYPYPPNYRAEFFLRSDDPASRVLLLFIDFDISHRSFIEITGNNGTHPTRFYGNIFRPPVIVSESNQLSLKFQSDDQSGMSGFRAISSFIKSVDSLIVPYTDCGGLRDGRGGQLNIRTHEGFGLYDCVWHIMPFTPFTKSNLSVSTNMQNIGHKSNLEFRRGRNSKSSIIREINCETEECNNFTTETILLASEDLFIRFNGYLDVYSVINMSYSTYHMGNCSEKEFKCENERCLVSDFRCDGIPHCPNGSDEKLCPSAKIYEDQVTSFPTIRTESFHDAIYNKFFIIVLLGSFGLITVIVSVLIFVYKYCKPGMAAEPILPQRTSGELSDAPPALYPVIAYDSDRPPSYEDFIKSSDCYPPLLYSRVKQRLLPKDACTQCTTSFCSGTRMRHHSADSFPLRNSDTDSGDIFLNITGDGQHPSEAPSTSRYDVEIIQNSLALKVTKNTMKRSYSLDSVRPDYHLLLSIEHSVCTHTSNHLPRVEWHTLPPNFKMSELKSSNENRPKVCKQSLDLNSSVNFVKERRFTWSFVPRNSVRSELITVVKTRCFSEPCNGINVHCSLY